MADTYDNDLIDKISKEDTDWYWSECKRIQKTLGYGLAKRRSGISALRMYLIAEKGYSVEQATKLDDMDSKTLKGLLEEMFKAYGDPAKTPQENARNIGRIHRKALDKINEIKIIDPAEIKSVKDMEKYNTFEKELSLMQIDASQDLQDLKDHPNDISLREAYYEGAGGMMSMEDKFGRWGSYSQGLMIIRGHITHPKYSSLSKADAFYLYKDYLNQYKGKTVADLPMSIGAHANNMPSLGVLSHAEYVSKGDVYSHPEHEAYLNGEADTYPGQERLMPAIKGIIEQTEQEAKGSHGDQIKDLTKMNMAGATASVPDFDGATADLLTLPEETQSKMIQAYYATFGMVYNRTSLMTMLDAECNPFDFIYTGDGKNIHIIASDKYKNYSPEQQEKAMMLETMRAVIKDPRGVNCSYLAKVGTNYSVPSPVNVNNTLSSICFSDSVYYETAAEYAELPEKDGVMFEAGKDIKKYFDNFFKSQMGILKNNGMDPYDAIIVGDRSLNEIYEEQYADKFPGIKDTDREALMCSILAAESFAADTPIYATVLSSDRQGNVSKSVVPLTFRGKNLLPGQDRSKNKEEIKQKCQQAYERRTALSSDPKAASSDALRRAEESVTLTEQRPELSSYNMRLNTIKQRAAIIEPSSREFLRRTLLKMEELNKDGALDEAIHDYNVNMRASKLTENAEQRAHFLAEAEKLKSASPLSDYNKYIDGLEYAYGLRKAKEPRQIPAELHSFFEEKTGHVVPGFVLTSDMDSMVSYRPTEISLALNDVNDGEKIDNLIDDIYKVAKWSPERGGDANQFILVGGMTLKELLQRQKGKSYRANMAGEDRSKILIDAMRAGIPVDFFVADSKTSSPLEISNIPIHVVPEGFSYSTIRPERLEEQKAAFNKVAGNLPKKIRTEEEFIRREARLQKHAQRDYDNYWKTEYLLSSDKGTGSTLWGMYAKYYPEGAPKVGQPLPGKLTAEEAEQLKGAIRPDRMVPINYVLNRLAAESLQRISEGKPGYTLDEMVSVNALADRKQFYADEFKRICAENDVESYYKNVKAGVDAMIEIVYNENVLKEAVENDASMEEAFLGKSLAFTGSILDSKQELELQLGLNFQLKIGLFENEKEALDYYYSLSDITAIGKTVQQKKVFERKISSGVINLSSGIGEYQEYDFMKKTVAEKAITGQDPFKNLITQISSQGALNDNDVINNVPLLDNELTDGNQDAIDKIADGTFMDRYDIDYEKLQQAADDGDYDAAEEAIDVTNMGDKSIKYQKMLSDFHKTAFDKRLDESREERKDALTLDENSATKSFAIELQYDNLFGPIFSRPAVQEYLKQNPDKTEFDLLRVGGYSLTEWAAREDSALSMKALALQCVADPAVPFGYVDVFYDPKENEFSMSEPKTIVDRANVERIALEKPYLRNMEGFKSYFKTENKEINTSNFSDKDWKELYENELNVAANEAPIPDAIIKTEQSMRDGTDPANPQEMAINYIESVYGAQQSFVTSWAGNSDGGSSVYTKEVFMNNYSVRNSGSFSNKDFAIMAYFTSLDPAVTTGDVYPEATDADVPHDLKVQEASNRWTSDIRAFGDMQPRPAMMNKLMSITVTPARQAVEEGITDLYMGNADKLAGNLSIGIKNALGLIKMQEKFNIPTGDCAHWAECLRVLDKTLKTNGALNSAVMDKLTAAEKDQLKAVIRMKELMNDAEKAKLQEKEALENGIELTREEKDRNAEAISTFKHYEQEWEANYNRYASSEGYAQRAIEMVNQKNTLNRQINKSTNEAEKAALSSKMAAGLLIYNQNERNAHNFSETFIKELSSDAPIYGRANDYVAEVNNLREFFMDNLKTRSETWNVFINEKGNLSNPDYSKLVAEDCVENKRKMTDSGYRLDHIKHELDKLFKKGDLAVVVDGYNKIAESKGWHTLNVDKKDNSRILNSVMYHNPEKCQVFFDLVFDELAKKHTVAPGFSKSIIEKKLPTDYTVEELSEPKYNKELDALKKGLKGNEAEKKAAEIILDEAGRNLSTRTKEVYDYFSNREAIGRTGTALGWNAEHTMDQYKNGKYTGLSNQVELADGKLKFSVIPPEKLEDALDFREETTGMSDENIEKVAAIAAKMKEYGMITGTSSAEEGNKIYGHHQLYNDYLNLEKAVKEGDIKKIEAANKDYKKHMDQMKEIYRMVKEAFPDENYAPGNIDNIRNEKIPAELSVQFVTNSRVNGIFQSAEMAMRMGVDFKDFIKNSSKHVIAYYEKDIKNRGFDAITKDENSFLGSYNKLYEAGDKEVHHSSFIMNSSGGSPDACVGRAMDGFTMLEGDKNKLLEYSRYKSALIKDTKELMEREANYIKGLYVLTNATPEALGGDKKAKEVKDKLKNAFLRGGKLTKYDLAMPQTMDNGMLLGSTFSYDGALSSKNRYNSILNSYNKCLGNVKKTGKNRGAELIEEAMFDYLMAHPEDIGTPGFNALEKAAMSAEKSFGISRPAAEAGAEKVPTIKEKYQKWRKDYKLEMEKLSKAVKADDKKVNKELARLQKELSKAWRSKRIVSKEVKDKLREEFDAVINERMQLLSEGMRCKEITPSYAMKRIKDLAELKNDWTNPIKNPPSFVEEKDPDLKAADVKMISEIVLNEACPGHLKSKEEYIKWRIKLNPDEQMERKDLTEEEWDLSYRNAIHAQQIERPVFKEAGFREESAEEREQRRQKEAIQELDDNFIANLGSQVEVNKNSTKLPNPEGSFEAVMDRLPSAFTKNDRIAKIKAPNMVGDMLERFIIDAIAICVAHDIIKDKGGVIPQNKDIVEFVNSIGFDKNFRATVKPYIENIHNEYMSNAANPEKQKNVAEYDSFKALSGDIRNKQIIRTAAMLQNKEKLGIAPEAKPQLNNQKNLNNNVQNNNPENNIIKNPEPKGPAPK